MSNLIPEKRINKHGVAVTKHVKLDSLIGKPSKPVPAPVLPSEREASIALLLEPLRELLGKAWTSKVKKTLNLFEDDTIRTAADVIMSHEEPYYAQVISECIKRENNEGFILLVGSTARVWGPCAEARTGGDESMSAVDVSLMVNDLWNTYVKMTPRNTTSDYALLSEQDDEVPDFDAEASAEAFSLEFLGSQLELEIHTRTKRDYYKGLEVLNDNMDDVLAILPELIKINGKLTTLDSYQNEVNDSLSVDQIKKIMDLSRNNPSAAVAISNFLQERKVFDEGAIEEFVNLNVPALGEGVL